MCMYGVFIYYMSMWVPLEARGGHCASSSTLLQLLKKVFYVFYFMCMSGLPGYMSMYHMCAQHPQKSLKGVLSFGTRVVDDCEPLSGFWETNIVLCKRSKYS